MDASPIDPQRFAALAGSYRGAADQHRAASERFDLARIDLKNAATTMHARRQDLREYVLQSAGIDQL